MKKQNLLCKWFGHKVSQTALLIAVIKSDDLNKGKPNILKCSRCGFTIDLNNQQEIDAYLKSIGKL